MIPLGEFAVYFVIASAVTATVNSLAYGGRPGKVVRESIHFFIWIILGILAFSAIVQCLELIFLPK